MWGVGGGGTWPSERRMCEIWRLRNVGGPEKNPRKLFEIFIPEIAENAPN